MIETEQETFFVIARHPRLTVCEHHVFGYVSRLGEVDQPSTDFGVIVNHQNTAAHDLEEKMY